jgi:pimeloyl-ACP methyl ester carboxylesterase
MEAGGATETTPPGLATWHRRRVMGMPQHVLAQAYAGMYTDADAFGTRLAAEAVLARRRCPTLALYSHEEPASWERGLPAPPGSTVVCWPGTGHYLHEEHPGDFVVVLRKWLAGLAAEGRLPCGR